MKVNFLEKFRENAFRIRFRADIKDSFEFNLSDIDFAIKILKDFFGENYFIVQQGLHHVDKNNLNMQESWIINHLAQSENSIGSILLILEISTFLYYFSHRETDKELLKVKFKKKNGDLKFKEFRSSYFEFYITAILERSGFKVKMDERIYKDKPLDIIINYEGKNVIGECKIITETVIEMQLSELAFFLSRRYFALSVTLEKDHNFELLKNLQTSAYLKFKDQSQISKSKNQFKVAIDQYIKNVKKLTCENIPLIINPIKTDDYEFCIEPYRDGLYENYYFNESAGVKFKHYFQGETLFQEIECKLFGRNNLENKLLSLISDIRNQHKDSTSERMVYFIEYEIYPGFRIPIDFQKKAKEKIKAKLKNNETFCFIEKNSSNCNMLNRKMTVISKDEDNVFVKKLSNLNLSPFIKIWEKC